MFPQGELCVNLTAVDCHIVVYNRDDMLIRLALLFLVATCVPSVFAQQPQPKTLSVAPAVVQFPPWRFVERTSAASEYAVAFESPVTSPYPENNHVDLRIFVPEDRVGPFPTVLILHYLGAVDLRSERVLAAELADRGMIAAIMTLPYHMGRTPAGHRSGELAIEPDPDRLRDSITQAVLDVRRSIDFLCSRPEVNQGRIGIAGISLGSLIAADAFAVDARIKHGAFVLGGADLAKILWTSSRVVLQREVLREKGFDEARLRERLRDVEPTELLRGRTTGTAFVIGGRFDTVMPKPATLALIAALPNVQPLWLDTGHYGGIFIQQRLLRLVASYFQIEFGGNTFTAPKSINAPTVRIGVKVDTSSGFQVGGGVDLFRIESRVHAFTSLFVTPKGPYIFLGHQVATGTAIGFSIGGRGIGGAVLWSSVL